VGKPERKRPHVGPRHTWGFIIKIDLKMTALMEWNGFIHGQVVSSCQQSSEPLFPIKYGGLFDHLRTHASHAGLSSMELVSWIQHLDQLLVKELGTIKIKHTDLISRFPVCDRNCTACYITHFLNYLNFTCVARPMIILLVQKKCTFVQALRLCTDRTAHRGIRGITLLFHELGTRRGWGACVTPQLLFTPGKD
jgi:hypothetical protein